MIVLMRREGQWAELVHKSGDVIRVKVRSVTHAADGTPRVSLAFDDDERNFDVNRPKSAPVVDEKARLLGEIGRHAGNIRVAHRVTTWDDRDDEWRWEVRGFVIPVGREALIATGDTEMEALEAAADRLRLFADAPSPGEAAR